MPTYTTCISLLTILTFIAIACEALDAKQSLKGKNDGEIISNKVKKKRSVEIETSATAPLNETEIGKPKGRAMAQLPTTTTSSSLNLQCGDFDDPARFDPFPLNIKWSQFVADMDAFTLVVKNATKVLSTILTTPEYTNGKDTFLANFKTTFKHISGIFKPQDRTLDDNKAYTKIDPAVDLQSIASCEALARSNPTTNLDKGRLKWIEVNAMAATVHYIFGRLTPALEYPEGLENVNHTMNIEYPSWVGKHVINETGNRYHLMDSPALTDYMHAEMDVLGERNHLIQVLEKILCKEYGRSGWNPSSTALNYYCFGKGGQDVFEKIYDNFDLLIDAAKYLVLADMKYSVTQLIYEVYKAHQTEIGSVNETKPADLPSIYEAVMKNMTERIDKKIKFSKLAEIPPDVAVYYGPTLFRCSATPVCNGTDGKLFQIRETAPNCPPGVYIENHKIFEHGTEILLPENHHAQVKLPNGNPLNCIGLDWVGVDANGTITQHNCEVVDGKCRGQVATSEQKPKLIPILLTPDRIPYTRDANGAGNNGLIQTFPDGRRWGSSDKCPQDISPADRCDQQENGHGVRLCDNRTQKYEPCPNRSSTLPPPFIDCGKPRIDTTNAIEWTLAFTGYLESELNLNKDGKCIGTCKEYRRPTVTCPNRTHLDLNRRSHCEPENQDCLASSKCASSAKRCEPTSHEVTICPALNGTGKLYEWLNISGSTIEVAGLSDSGIPFDHANPTCQGRISKANQRWAMENGVILNTPQYCELCLCVCNDPMSDEGRWFFDVAALQADTANGFVVTALKFERRGKNVLLNIQQGKIQPGGTIDQATLKWLEPTENPDARPLGTAAKGFNRINMDTIVGRSPADVVTGLRWKAENSTLKLEIGYSKFDGTSLNPEPSFFRGPTYPIPAVKRTRFGDAELLSPLKQRGPSQPYPIPENQHFIKWDASSLKKDMGSAVVPFIDMQAVQFSLQEVKPFRQVKIEFLAKQGSGGFIAMSGKFLQ